MITKKATGEEIAEHFDSLPRSAGSVEDRLFATARYFKIKPETVKKHLQFWWPGKKFLSEFGPAKTRRPKWDRPTKELLSAMREHVTVNKAAKALQTTPITLSKALQRHQIEQEWVIKQNGNGNRASG